MSELEKLIENLNEPAVAYISTHGYGSRYVTLDGSWEEEYFKAVLEQYAAAQVRSALEKVKVKVDNISVDDLGKQRSYKEKKQAIMGVIEEVAARYGEGK